MASRLAEIKAVLLTSGVQQTNQPLWQAINQLLDYLIRAENTAASGASGGGSTAVASQILQLLFQELGQHDDWILIPGPRGLEGIQGLIGPPGQDGIDGEDSFIPGQKGDTGPTGPPGIDGDCGGCGFALLGIPSDAIPAAGSGESFTEETTTATGTQNNFDLDGRWTYLRCNNASALVFTGFTVLGSAPQTGDLLIIDNIGSSTVRVADEDGGSTAANQVICESIRGQIIGADGRMVCIYDGTSDRWRLSCISPGAKITIAFNAGDFTVIAPSTWTVDAGDLLSYQYQQTGRNVRFDLSISTSTIGVAAVAVLLIAMPNSFTSSAIQILAYGRIFDSVGWAAACGGISPSVSTTAWVIFPADGAAIPTNTDATYVRGSLTVEVD